jgi:hypothetical protein
MAMIHHVAVVVHVRAHPVHGAAIYATAVMHSITVHSITVHRLRRHGNGSKNRGRGGGNQG